MVRTFRDEIAELVPYEPGKPAEELMRERRLSHVVKLASNEGPWGPLPAACQAIARATGGLNRYPDGGTVLLRKALAERHDVTPATVIVGHGADAVINNISLAMLRPGDEAVFGWPSFPSYLLDARKMGATPVMVPLDDADRYDLDAMLAAITERTRVVYVCNPNNPTGTMVDAIQLSSFLDKLPEHVLPVIDEAYFEYVQRDGYPDSIRDHFRKGRDVVVLRTFSKIFGLAGLRVGYAVAPVDVADAVNKVRNAFDVTTLAQEAALASLAELDQLASRCSSTNDGRKLLDDRLGELGLEPVDSVANFVCARVGGDADELYDALLDEGVIVRPLRAFGMPDAIRVTVGTAEENRFALDAFERVLRR